MGSHLTNAADVVDLVISIVVDIDILLKPELLQQILKTKWPEPFQYIYLQLFR